MRAIFFAFIMVITYCNFAAYTSTLPKTSITFNEGNCAVQVETWLSPSCTHCKDYFLEELPKIIALPGFCLGLHFLPHLYLLDMPIAVLIWSKGPQEAYSAARFFYETQNEWLNLSASRDALDDSRRIDDLNSYLNEVMNKRPGDFQRIKNYLKANDPYLYVKIVALRYFSIEHLERYLPNGTQMVDPNLSLSLMSNLPVKDNKVVNFSPVFTSSTGQVIPDNQLHKGILTFDVAKEMLDKAGPFVPPASSVTAPPPKGSVKIQTGKKVKSQAKKSNINSADQNIQDVDEEVTTKDEDQEIQDADAHEADDNLEDDQPDDTGEKDSAETAEEDNTDNAQEEPEEALEPEPKPLPKKRKLNAKPKEVPTPKKRKLNKTYLKPSQNSNKKVRKRKRADIDEIIEGISD